MKWLRPCTVLLLLWAGCAETGGPGVDSDAGADQFMDASMSGTDAGPQVPPPSAEYDDTGLAGGSRGCFDGVDNNRDGTTDCGDPSCQSNLPSCCVGISNALCCQPGSAVALPISECTGELGACGAASGYEVFGATGPSIATRVDGVPTLVPNGEGGVDSGAVRLEQIDPRHGTVTLRASIATGAPVEDAEIESLGFGLIDAERAPSELTRVEPLVGAVISRNRARVILQLGSEAIVEEAIDDPTMRNYTLTVSPEGVATLTIGTDAGQVTLTAQVTLDRAVRVAVWGRTPTGAIEPPRMASLTVAQDTCDMPGALNAGPVVVPAPTDPAPTWRLETQRLERPHLLRFDDGAGQREWMVLRADGDIHVAVPGEGGYVDAFDHRVLEPIADGWAEDGVDYPRLRYLDGTLELWFTGYDAGGRGTIAVASWDSVSERFVDPQVIGGLEADASTSYEGAAPFDAFGIRYLVARVSDAIGDRLVLFSLGAGDATASEVTELRRTRPEELTAFDRDELGAPQVVEAGGILRLYFSGRRGNRWSLGVMVSDDALQWHAPLPGALVGSGEAGFDVLGRRDPAPIVDGGALRLYFAGDDGVRTRIGRLDGRVPL